MICFCGFIEIKVWCLSSFSNIVNIGSFKFRIRRIHYGSCSFLQQFLWLMFSFFPYLYWASVLPICFSLPNVQSSFCRDRFTYFSWHHNLMDDLRSMRFNRWNKTRIDQGPFLSFKWLIFSQSFANPPKLIDWLSFFLVSFQIRIHNFDKRLHRFVCKIHFCLKSCYDESNWH